MEKGIVTYITINRNRTATKIRIGSRKWVLLRYINLDEYELQNLIGSHMSFTGTWKKTPSFGKIFMATDYVIEDRPDDQRTIKRINHLIDKHNLKISENMFNALENILILLFIIGKKTLLQKFIKWPKHRQYRYNANPYLFFLNSHLDYYSAEVLSSFKAIPVPDDKKIQALILKLLDDAYKDGDESLSMAILRERVTQLMRKDISFQRLLDIISETPKVAIDGENVFLVWIFYLRKNSLSRLAVNETIVPDKDISDDYLKQLLVNKWTVLAGDAGTGKSTLLRKLADIDGLNVVYCATTGNAARILSKNAVTLHNLFKYRRGKFTIQYLQDCDLLVVDESSMLTWHMLHAVVKAVPRAIFAGDHGQLPPVHGESVFKVLMTKIPVIKLEKNWRFANGNASPDIEIVTRQDSYSILNSVKSLVSVFRRKGSNFQVLSPVKSGLLGTDNLNRSIQNTVNMRAPFVGTKKYFRLADKVIVTDNIYIDGELVASNGEVGSVTYQQGKYIAVKFNPNKVILIDESDIDLSYALTIHKAQGSEYDYVIFVVPPNVNEEFLTKELINTGRTRGKYKTYVFSNTSIN